MSATKDHYEITSDAKSTTIRLQPDIGDAAWGDIEQVGEELLSGVNEKKSSAWLVDLSQLEYMGSALVALLVRIWKAVQSSGGRVVVVCDEGMPLDVIRLAGLDKVWTISATAAEGYKSLGVRPPVALDGGSASGRAAPAGSGDGGFPVLGVLSFVAALVAGGALALILQRVEVERNLAQLGMFGGAGIAVALGVLSFFKETSWGRGLGCVALLAGIAIGAVGYQHRPGNTEDVSAPQGTSLDPEEPQTGEPTTDDPQSESESPPEESSEGSGESGDVSTEETHEGEAETAPQPDAELTSPVTDLEGNDGTGADGSINDDN